MVFISTSIFLQVLYNSNRHIEPELLKIVNQYSLLEEISQSTDDKHVLACLFYIVPKETVGSLTAHDKFDLKKYSEFLTMSKNVKEKAGIGSEPFPGEFLKPMKEGNLPLEIVALLVEYYNSAYDYSFTALSNVHASLADSIVVLPKLDSLVV